MTFQDICKEIAATVDSHGKMVYGESEARAVARVLVEDVLGLNIADLYGGVTMESPNADFLRTLDLVTQGVPV